MSNLNKYYVVYHYSKDGNIFTSACKFESDKSLTSHLIDEITEYIKDINSVDIAIILNIIELEDCGDILHSNQ